MSIVAKNDYHTLEAFVNQLDAQQQFNLKKIQLFQSEKVAQWTMAQKRYFSAIFYHSRGHFHDFMWFLANFTNNPAVKDIVLSNIKEEFNPSGLSHEKLYELFASEFGVNIVDEILNETHYLPFVRAFNKGHLRWLSLHTPEEQLAAFAAYERLDNIDYPFLLDFAKSLGVSKKGLIFFNVHIHVEHFSSTLDALSPVWESDKEKVMEAFNFIYSHQLLHWQQLSETIFNYCEDSVVDKITSVEDTRQYVN